MKANWKLEIGNCKPEIGRRMPNFKFQISNHRWPILIISILLIFFTSCEKVIYVDLNSVNPKLVVEGNITDQPGPYIIRLSNTVNYYDPNAFPAVKGATITVSDNAGNSEILKETSPGVYETSSLQGVSGRTYTMNIVTGDGTSYSAHSTTNQ